MAVDLQHPIFIQPDNPRQELWRYMSFAKLVDFLVHQELYLCRLDRFPDANEGTIPRSVLEGLRRWLNEQGRESSVSIEATSEIFAEAQMRNKLYANCWCARDYEDNLLWNSFASNGFAIKTTYDRLVRVIENSDSNDTFYIGKVNYVDFHGDYLGDGYKVKSRAWNALTVSVLKDKYYSSENEIRVVVAGPDGNFQSVDQIHGISIKIDAADLVGSIIANPHTPQWRIKTIRKLCEKLGLGCHVVPSKIQVQ